MNDDFFATPPFRPVDALAGLKRQLRSLGLAERGAGFELRGLAVLRLALGDTAIDAQLAQHPARSPAWTAHTLRSAADVRRFLDTVRQQLGRWSADD